jgi:hypothetical protein
MFVRILIVNIALYQVLQQRPSWQVAVIAWKAEGGVSYAHERRSASVRTWSSLKDSSHSCFAWRSRQRSGYRSSLSSWKAVISPQHRGISASEICVQPRACCLADEELDRREWLQVQRNRVVATAVSGALGMISSAPILRLSRAVAAPGSESYNSDLVGRFEGSNDLIQPDVLSSSSGIDNTLFPPYLLGTWDVTQTLQSVQAPLGLQYLGGPQGNLDIAKQSMMETEKLIHQPVQFKLRFVPTVAATSGSTLAVEDRIYNTIQRLNAYAGRPVVASVDYRDTIQSNRAAILKQPGGTNDTPLATTLIRYKGPAIQKIFVTSHHTGIPPSQPQLSTPWYGYECQRSIFALTNQSTAPPITTDTESIWKLDPQESSDLLLGQLRILAYLVPSQDQLYFQARKRAVSIQDYSVEMRRIKSE